MTKPGALAWVVVASACGLVAACAAVANLEVRHEREPVIDDDDAASNAPRDAGDAALGPVDATTDGEDAPSKPSFLPCACAEAEGCCVPSSGAGTCLAPAEAPACDAKGGIFLRCVGPDLANGRACCLARDARSSFFATRCDDAGAKLCVGNDECAIAAGETCVPTTCRDVATGICAPPGGSPPTCPR